MQKFGKSLNCELSKKRLLIALYVLFQFVILFVLWKTGNLKYNTNDDWMLNSYLDGIYGKYTAFNYFNNVVYGFVLTILYKYIPIWNWMVFFYILVILTANISLLLIGLNRNESETVATISALIFTFATFSSMYMDLNFTKIAGLASIFGLILAFDAIERESRNRFELILGFMLLAYGITLRFTAAIMPLPFAICFLINSNKKFNKGKIKVCLAIAVVVLVLQGINTLAYKDNEGWNFYAENSTYSSAVMDYGLLTDNTGIDYDEVGLTEEDVRFYSGWNLGDKKVFTNEKLKKLVSYKNEKIINIEYVRELIQTVFSECTNYNFFIAAIAMLFMAAVVGNVWQSVAAFVLMGGELFYLAYGDRMPERVVIVPCICGLAIAIYLINKSWPDLDKSVLAQINTKAAIALLMVLSIVVLDDSRLVELKNEDGWVRNLTAYEDFFAGMDQDNNTFIFTVGSELDQYYSVFDMPTFGEFRNVVYDSDFLACTPVNYERIEELGDYKSIYEALTKRDDVFLVDEAYLWDKKDFINRNYDANVDVCHYYGINEIDAYSFTPTRQIDEQTDKDSFEIMSVENPKDSDFYEIVGNFSTKEIPEVAYLSVSDGITTYFYQIKIDGNEFSLGIPEATWSDSNSLTCQLVTNQDGKLVGSVEKSLQIK